MNAKSVKFVTTFDTDAKGVRTDIETVVDIYNVAEQIRKVIRDYETAEAEER